MVVEHELILSINKLLPSVKFINVFEDHLISVRSHQSISITRESCFLEYHQRSTLYDFQCRPLYYGRHRRLSEYFHHYGLTGRSIAIYLGTNEREIDFLHVRRWIYRWCLFFKKQIVRKKNENFIRRWRTRRKCKKTIQSILFFFDYFRSIDQHKQHLLAVLVINRTTTTIKLQRRIIPSMMPLVN